MKRLVLTTMLLMAFTLAHADYHYAGHSGSNTYPYTSWETAADSITAAMNAASPGDTIYIGSGVFNEVIRAGIEDTNLVFIGAGIDSTVLTENTSPNLWLARDNTLIRDVAFINTGDTRSGFGGYFDASLIAINCKFTGGIGILAAGGSGDSTYAEDCEFINCWEAVNLSLFSGKLIFKNNIFHHSLNNRDATALYGDWSNALIENNIFYIIGNGHLSIFDEYTGFEDSSYFRNNYIDGFGDGHTIMSTKRAIVENNTVRRIYYNNPYGGHGFWVNYGSLDSGTVVFRDNCITECGIGIYAPHDSLSIRYNAFWGNIHEDMQIVGWEGVDTLGNFDAFPMYANPDSFDVHLQAYSPLIDAGDPNILDVDGTRSDIGCYGGPGGCSYTYLDLAPKAPDSLRAFVDTLGINITWRNNYEADFNRYQVFRDTFPGFSPSVFNQIAEPETSLYLDPHINPGTSYFYRLTSVDNQNNVSGYSSELAVRPVSIGGFDVGDNLPRYSVIENAYPNPFNQDITIVYSASNLGPQPPEIKLFIYDIQGRVVRTLVNEHKPVGTYRVVWDGCDDQGARVASGSYIAHLSQWGMSSDIPIKITLVK
jgi:hypothetical protein